MATRNVMRGKGVSKAVRNVNETIARALHGFDATDQAALDKKTDRTRRHA